MIDKAKADEKSLRGAIESRAAGFPGSGDSPYVADVEDELARVCDWLARTQNDEGLWPEGKANLRFYSDSYAVRALLAAWKILGERKYIDAAEDWLRHFVGIQRSDGGWWVGYGAGDHDWDDPDCDQSVVYCADSGEITMALVAAYHFLNGGELAGLADQIETSLLNFRRFTDQFRLRSGAMGLGYTHRDFYAPGSEMRPFMQSHYLPYPFATVAVGVGFNAGLYTITGDEADWEKAMQSLDWCLEHLGASQGGTLMYNDPGKRDLVSLHRVTDWIFDISPAPLDESSGDEATPEPRYADPRRQRLYGIWKYLMHVVADLQSELGEWPVVQHDKEVVLYTGALRHRIIFLYSLTSYLGNMGPRAGEDDRLDDARDRQMWLCAEPRILHEHYGVCMNGAHVMPTGLWGMTLAEMLHPGITLVGGIRRAMQ